LGLAKISIVNAISLCDLDAFFLEFGGGVLVFWRQCFAVATPALEES
jgi:hypothetical protein